MNVKKRYERSSSAVTAEENRILGEKKVCVAGCGGLGGTVIEGLVRTGVGTVRAVDGDVFDETNLNRQVLSCMQNLGRKKSAEAEEQMRLINPDVIVEAVDAFIGPDNAADMIRGCDAAVDALDNVEARLILERACEEQGIPLVHGAVSGWNGQAAVIMPGDRMLHTLYEDAGDCSEDRRSGNPFFTPAAVAAVQVAETVKLLLSKDSALRSRLLVIDMLSSEYEIMKV